MEEGDIKAPMYYVMGRKANVEKVQRLLTITPCFYGVASNPEDKEVLEPLVQDVLFAPAAQSVIAEHVSRTTGKAVLIAGDGDQLKAVYSTGEEEIICQATLPRNVRIT